MLVERCNEKISCRATRNMSLSPFFSESKIALTGCNEIFIVHDMKKPRDASEIKNIQERILKAALDVIVQEGYPALTMRRIASKIDMTAPNIYNYYQSKDELYISLVIRGFEILKRELSSVCDAHENPVNRGAALARAYINFGLKHSSYYDIMFTYPTPKYNDYVGTPLEKLSEVEYKMSMEIVTLVLEAVRALLSEDLAKDEQAVQMRFIAAWSMLHGMISLHNSKVVRYTVEDAEAMYEKMIPEFLPLFLRS
ncbi:MAG: TetR/AcrR family transcriptional regulator [Smithella sp.]|nr:TetR/AcrR family transcriptional regulator [Smithella sp.]